MNLQELNFPTVNRFSVSKPANVQFFNKLLEEAEERGFANSETYYRKLFKHIFFAGGTLYFKEGIPEHFKQTAYSYMIELMHSPFPKYSEKEAVCALILSELAQPDKVNFQV
jgi:hypothetical protein